MKNLFVTKFDETKITYFFSDYYNKKITFAVSYKDLKGSEFFYEDDLISISINFSEKYYIDKRRTLVFSTNNTSASTEKGELIHGTYNVKYKFADYFEFVGKKDIKRLYPEVVSNENYQNLGVHTSNRTKANYSCTNVNKPFHGGKFR